MAKGSHLPPRAAVSGRGQPYSVLVLLSLKFGAFSSSEKRSVREFVPDCVVFDGLVAVENISPNERF